jgi:hypothetical protein
MLYSPPLRVALLVALPLVIGTTALKPEATHASEATPATAASSSETATIAEPVPARIELLPDLGGVSLDLVLLGLLGLGYGAYQLHDRTASSESQVPAARSTQQPSSKRAEAPPGRRVLPPSYELEKTRQAPNRP